MLVAVQAFPQIAHPWQGKKVAYFGDSITDPNHRSTPVKYWGFLQEWLGITPYVYAVSGRTWTDIPRQTDALMKEHGDDVDAILIFIGTNDYNKGVPLGEWYTEVKENLLVFDGEQKQYEKRIHRIPCMTDSTYRGSINIAMAKLKKMYPTKQIVVMTPIHRSVFFNKGGKIQQTEEYSSRGGTFLESYIQANKEIGNVWAVPVIDLNALCGLYPLMDEHAQYFYDADTDRLHPNQKGHERMARTLMYQLMALPCTF